jgi:hypothetical protein
MPEGSGRSFDQNQFAVAGDLQPVCLLFVLDQDLAGSAEEFGRADRPQCPLGGVGHFICRLVPSRRFVGRVMTRHRLSVRKDDPSTHCFAIRYEMLAAVPRLACNTLCRRTILRLSLNVNFD